MFILGVAKIAPCTGISALIGWNDSSDMAVDLLRCEQLQKLCEDLME
ncbi:MAG: hypothetical protein Q8L48_19765 [Archangium sp.]|nr:hypothetical protein [Archangium sp.]